ncbi:MAG: cytochrome P450 [Chloroflexota bacterium]
MTTTTDPNPYNIFENSGNHTLYKQVREEDPVHCAIGPMTGNRFWWIMRYEDCAALVKDLRIGKEVRTNLPPELADTWPQGPEWMQVLDKHMLNMDPPNHTRLKNLVHKAFTPRIVRELQPRIQEICDELLDEVEAQGRMDIISDYAGIVPAVVIAELLGVPREDQDKFRKWTKALIFSWDDQERMLAGMEFAQYMNAQIDRRATEKPDDVLTGLVDAEEEGDSLDREELMSMIFLLLAAGHETTVHLIGNGTVALLKYADQRKLLMNNLDNPDIVGGMVEETLRYNGPAPTTLLRYAFDDVEIGGKTINKGDGVFICFHSANRDPEVFENPDTFDITRSPNKHLGFGGGIHYCLGAPLARLEGAIAIPTLLKRFPNLQLDTTELEYDNKAFHGYKSIPVTF